MGSKSDISISGQNMSPAFHGYANCRFPSYTNGDHQRISGFGADTIVWIYESGYKEIYLQNCLQEDLHKKAVNGSL